MDMKIKQQNLMALARTFLFVPADRPERFARALAAGPGAVVIDLEDAVAPGRKEEARHSLTEGVAALTIEERKRILVRINAFATPWHSEDLELMSRLSPQGLGGVMFPKAERSADLAPMVSAIGIDGVLVPLIESVKGLDAIDELARAPQVLRLAFGHLDFQADLGLSCDSEELELVSVRLKFALATRRAGLASPIDGVTVDCKDLGRVRRDALRARRGGFGAKLCIHPAQLPVVHEALGPTSAEVIWAQRVLEAAQAAVGGVVSLDGRMIDMPVVLLAERLLYIHQQGEI